MQLKCSGCSSVFAVPDEWAARAQGVSIPCKKCGRDLTVGGVAPPPLPNRSPSQSALKAQHAPAKARIEPDDEAPLERTLAHGVAAMRSDDPEDSSIDSDESAQPQDASAPSGYIAPRPAEPNRPPVPPPRLPRVPEPPWKPNAPRRWPWFSAAAAIVLIGLAYCALSPRVPSADVYVALSHESPMRSHLSERVRAGVAAVRKLPTGDPKQVAVCQSAIAEIESKIDARAVELEQEVTAAQAQVDAAESELATLASLGSLGRTKERKASGNRFVEDYDGGHFETTWTIGWKTCGDDHCGGTCGTCSESEICFDSFCRCVPKCAGKSCGGDGCGGQCGACDAGYACQKGTCAGRGPALAAPPVGCVPSCGADVASPAISNASSKGARGKAAKVVVSTGTDAALRHTFAATTGRGQPLSVAGLDDWLTTLDKAMTALDKAPQELNEARASKLEAAGEMTAAATSSKKAKDELKGATKQLAAAKKSAGKAAVDQPSPEITRLEQSVAALKTSIQKSDDAAKAAKIRIGLLERRIKELDRAAHQADVQRPQVAHERERYRALQQRITQVRAAVEAGQRAVDHARQVKTDGAVAMMKEFAPKLNPLRKQLASLLQPFMSRLELPIGGEVGGEPGDHLLAPESSGHLAAITLDPDEKLELRLTAYAAKLQGHLATRRAAWHLLTAADQKKYAPWQDQDDELARHLADVDALVASNTRLRRIWQKLEP